MLKILAVAALLLGAPAAFSQTVSSCPTAVASAAWAKGAWLPCSTTVAYIAQPVPATTLASDMRCPIPPATGACVFSWQLGPKVLPEDQVRVKTIAIPTGTWVKASTLKFAGAAPSPFAQCLTYLYTGASFTMSTTTGPNTTPISSPLTGFVILAAPLPANGITVVTPIKWDFGSPLNFTNQDAFDTPAVFSFSTQGGTIVSWQMSINYNNGGGVTQFNIAATSSVNGDSVQADYFDAESNIPPTTIVGSSTSPGKWTCQLNFTSNYP
jgi:hypothetical protein